MFVLLLFACLAVLGELRVDPMRGFAIEVPEGWRTSESEVPGRGHVLTLLPPGSAGEIAVSVQIGPLPGEGAESLREAALGRIGARADEYGEPESFSARHGGREVPALAVDLTVESGVYHIVQTYLAEGERGVTLQRHAPRDRFDDVREALEAVARTFTWREVSEEGATEARIDELARRCGSELDWARDWDEAARRAREEGKLVLACAFFLGGFSISNTPRTTTFMDEDVVALVRTRFVPLWLEKGMRTPLEETYGLGPASFGQALIVARPDGEVVADTHETAPLFAHRFLRAALERAGMRRGPRPPQGASPLEAARHLFANGELGEAEERLVRLDSAEAHLLRARIRVLACDGPGALAALAAARKAGADEAQVLTEEAQVLLREERIEEARAALDRVLAEYADRPAALEAALVRGLVDLLDRDRDGARRRWRRLALEHPESRWGWQAAALSRSTALTIDARPSFAWPDSEVLDELLRFPEPDPLPPSRAGKAARKAARWLLAHQRADGSWATTTQLDASPDLGPDPFVDSVTALGARALLAHGGREARAAAERALSFLVRSVRAREETPPVVLFMDYMTWSDAMMLQAIADALEQGAGEEDELRATAEALVADLAGRQVEGAGWSYYVTSDLAGDGAPAQSISFTTAACVTALARVREAGVEVPAEMFRSGVAALKAMRDDDGVFAYFLYSGSGTAARGTGVPGAVGRGPACELALADAGESDPRRLADAVARFLAHRALYTAEEGKALMHAGPDAQGCHYLLFDYAHAALAQARAPRDREGRTLVLELLLGVRQPDGSFLDTPLLGRAYGTAMALLGLEALDV